MPLINSISELNQPIDIQKTVSGVNEYHVQTTKTETVFSTWAKVLTRSLVTVNGAAYTWAADETVFVVRHEQPKTIATGHRILWNGSPYQVTDVNYDNAKGEWDVITTKPAPAKA